jgi:hypothetical protein
VLSPPPEAVAPLPVDLHPDLTTRDRVVLQTRPESCQSCHAMINPLGFTLEHYDAVGRYRNEERGRAVDASGEYLTRDGELVKFTGVQDLASFLAASPESHDAFVEQLFHYMVKQPIRAHRPDEVQALKRSFNENGYSIRQLVKNIAVIAARAGSAAAAQEVAAGASAVQPEASNPTESSPSPNP